MHFDCLPRRIQLNKTNDRPPTLKNPSHILLSHSTLLHFLPQYYVMDQNEMCRLIIARHQKLRSLREQAANDNQTIKRLFIAAIKQLLSEEKTQESAYEEISQLVITASPILAKSLAEEIVSRLKSAAAGLQEHLIFWGRAYDGSMDKKKYPNFKGLLEPIRIKNEERQLSAKFRGYYQQFQKNFNQLNDERVEFFEDFDDDVLSDSMDNDSKIEEIIYLNIMELKMARSKLEREKLTEEALLEQINKIRHFVTLRPPAVLTDSEKNQYEKELKWAKNFLAGKEEEMRQNPSVSINQTFNLSLDEENIEILNKKDFQQPRKLNNQPKKSREIFTDSVDFRDEPNRESKTGYKVGGGSKLQPYISPIKHISDPKYNPHSMGESMDSQLSIRNDDKKKLEIAKLKSEFEQNPDEEKLEYLVVHKYKAKPQESNFNKYKELQKPRDFSVTENYFNKEPQSRTANEFASPKTPENYKSETMKEWKKSEYLSPSKNSRLKLSQFTSNKKQRKQLVPRQQIALPQEYALNPYLAHFQTLPELTKFRRDCFQHSFTIFASPSLLITCNVFKQVNTQIRIQILFTNNTNSPLEIQNVYKIPKCYRIQKKCKISKRFSLHTNVRHVFLLDVQEFPLEACLINLKFRMRDSQIVQAVLPLPITIINFVEYLHTSEDQWIEEWTRLANRQNKRLFMMSRHLEVDRQVVRQQFDWILREYFIRAGSIQGYSIQDFGTRCYYSALNSLKFLLRLSVRVDNIISLQVVSCRPVNDNQQDFIKYVLNIWMMLLSKLYF